MGEAEIGNQPQYRYDNKKNKTGEKEKSNENSFLGLRFFHVDPNLKEKLSAVSGQLSASS
jgi:hypothetical protein